MKILPLCVFLTAVFLLLGGCATAQSGPTAVTPSSDPSSTIRPALRSIASATSTKIDITPSLFPNGSADEAATNVPPPPTLAVTSTATISASPPAVPSLPAEETLPSLTSTLVPTPIPAEPTAAVPNTDQTAVNGVPVSDIVIMPPNVRDNVRRIFLEGRQLGRNPHAFSKLGDSVTLTDHYLTRFDSGHYTLGPFEYLQPAIDYYQGSFARFGVAARVGLHAWSIFDPLWANKDWCLANEDMVSCEIRLHNPSVLLIKIGSNDSGDVSVFEEKMRLLLAYAIENGVVPVLATKADRFEGPDDRNNRVIRQLANEYALPLWDYDRIAGTLPRRGLSGDDVHMTMADADDYTKPETFERGYPVSDLTALMTLYEIMQEVTAVGDA